MTRKLGYGEAKYRRRDRLKRAALRLQLQSDAKFWRVFVGSPHSDDFLKRLKAVMKKYGRHTLCI